MSRGTVWVSWQDRLWQTTELHVADLHLTNTYFAISKYPYIHILCHIKVSLHTHTLPYQSILTYTYFAISKYPCIHILCHIKVSLHTHTLPYQSILTYTYFAISKYPYIH